MAGSTGDRGRLPFHSSDEVTSRPPAGCTHWHSNELLPIAHSLSDILMRAPDISGVAITGSVARYESHVHDIDLIMFHNGKLDDSAFVTDIRTPFHRYGRDTEYVKAFTSASDFLQLSETSKEIPVHYILVHEKILQDCDYLQSFLPHLKKRGFFSQMRLRLKEMAKEPALREKIDEFYSTVFCDIPLLLVDPPNVRGAVLEYAIRTSGVYMGSLRSVVPISHQCGDVRCRPMKLWAAQRWEVKKEQGYSCVAEQKMRHEAAQNGLSLSAGDRGTLSFPESTGKLSLVKK